MNFTRYNTILCLFLALFVASCSKDSGGEHYDGIKMRVSLKSGIVQDVKAKASASGTTSSNSGIQTQIISLGSGYSVEVELVPEQQSQQISTKQSTSGLRAAATEVRNDLPTGTQYRLLVYNTAGAEVYRQDRTVGANTTEFEEFDLTAEGQYTFIAYSAGTADIPDLEGTTLDDFYVTVRENDDKFMHFVQTVNVVYGINNLDVVLFNKLTEITTIIDATSGADGNLITSVSAHFANASYSTDSGNRARVKLSDGTMTYHGSAADKTVTFQSIPAGGATVATSNPTVLVHDNTNTAQLVFSSFVIGGLQRPFEVSNIDVEPGVKYDLRLKIKGYCLEDISDQEFSQYHAGGSGYDGGILSSVFEFVTGQGQNLVLNIAELDNSFNMVINGTPLATKEIEFQTGTNIDHTARFTSGASNHGSGGNSQIYNMTGTKAEPVIRLTLSTNGTVTMQAKRTQNGTLQNMELYNGASWNNVTWYSDGVTPNVVEVSQYITGVTRMNFFIEGGQRIVACD